MHARVCVCVSVFASSILRIGVNSTKCALVSIKNEEASQIDFIALIYFENSRRDNGKRLGLNIWLMLSHWVWEHLSVQAKVHNIFIKVSYLLSLSVNVFRFGYRLRFIVVVVVAAASAPLPFSKWIPLKIAEKKLLMEILCLHLSYKRVFWYKRRYFLFGLNAIAKSKMAKMKHQRKKISLLSRSHKNVNV